MRWTWRVSFRLSLAVALVALALMGSVAVPAATQTTGFQGTVMLSGLDGPTALRFAPDGKVFVAEQRGIIKEFSSLSDTSPSIYADLRTSVHNYDDRGLLGLAIDPGWPTNPYVYALYTYDAAIGGHAPVWGSAGDDSDPCPDPNQTGCLASGRLSRLQQGPTTSVAYRDAVLADAPTAYWRLDDTSGTTAADASGNNHPGSYLGSPSLGLPGALINDTDTAVGFNGTSQYVEVPYSAALNPSSFSIEAWVYVSGGQGTYRSVVTSRNYDATKSVATGYAIYAANDNTWQLFMGSGGANWQEIYGPPVQLNQWTQLVATYDGTTARLYVNGLQAASSVGGYTPNTTITSPLRIAAGATEGAPRYYFPGRVDEVASYSSVLSPTRIHAHYESATGAPPLATETVLINDWCQQFTSGSVGDLAFGPDGALYASAGAGASYEFADWGQNGNPCGDPPGAVGTNLSPPTAEGGSLRSQDLQTSGDPVTLDGSVIRVDASTGTGMPDNPLASSTDPNARRIVAYGFRNPFRFTFRPGTNELWVGDVGGGGWEEIDRVVNPLAPTLQDFGWPCYEGAAPDGEFQAANLNICTTLYGNANTTTPPYFSYPHEQPVGPLDTCAYATPETAISGVAFIPDDAPYPAAYQGALAFEDYGRGCIWVMLRGSNGLPDPSTTQVLVANAGFPVDLQVGPDHKLYYVDVGNGTLNRVDYTSTDSTPPSGGSISYANGYTTTASVSITLDPGTDSGSGINTAGTLLQRAAAPLSNNSCGTFGSFSTIATAPASPYIDATVSSGNCYEYQYVVPDNAGNTTTYTSPNIVKVDTTAPSVPTVSFGTFTNASVTGSVVYYRPGATGGSFTLTAASTDNTSGIAGYVFPTFPTGWTSTPGSLGVNTYSYSSANPIQPSGNQAVQATNNAGLASTGTNTNNPFTVVPDPTGPSGGSISYPNGTSATVAVTFSAGTDSGSGINTAGISLQRASASLSSNICGTFGSFSTIATNPTSPYADATISGSHCYEYQYVVPDNVGNTTAYTSTSVVKVGDFSLGVSPSSRTVARGAGTSYVVTVAPSNGFSGNVTLSVNGLPRGADGTFSPNPVAVSGGSATSTLIVTTKKSTPRGTWTVTITGVAGSLTHATSTTLVVQ